jgi:succinate dehydrogenase flavin-adding protein (antitoxin of CptAB toxin-antitoxin module)
MKFKDDSVQETLQVLAKLEQQEPSVFADLVLLSRSEHLPAISLHSVSRLHNKGFIIECNFKEELVTLDEDKIEVLRECLNESKPELKSWLKRVAEDYPAALAELYRAISTLCSIEDEDGSILRWYHLAYLQNGICYPLSLTYELENDIVQLMAVPQQKSDSSSE